MNETLTKQASQIISGVDGRYFLVQPDGSIQTRNAHNKIQQFVFERYGSAQAHARRSGALIFDKQRNRFIADEA